MTVEIAIKFHAGVCAVVGVRETTIEVPTGSDTAMLLERLVARYPPFAKVCDHVYLAVNRVYAKGSVELKDGDEVSVFPPVLGG